MGVGGIAARIAVAHDASSVALQVTATEAGTWPIINTAMRPTTMQNTFIFQIAVLVREREEEED